MRRGTCKHFNGTFHNTHCQCGVSYASVTTDPSEQTGIALRIPCHKRLEGDLSPSQLEHYNRRGSCDKYEEPSEEDLRVQEEAIQASISKIVKAGPLIKEIKEAHKGKNWQGVRECPVCEGEIHISHAACNGHVWMKCVTDGCISFME